MDNEHSLEIEEPPEQQLIRLLRERGLEDPETKELFIKWTSEQEQLVAQSSDHFLEEIHVNLRRARLCYEAGYIDEAYENYNDALTQAWQEERHELCRTIKQEMQSKR